MSPESIYAEILGHNADLPPGFLGGTSGKRAARVIDCNGLPLDQAESVYAGHGLQLGARAWRDVVLSGPEKDALQKRFQAIENVLDPERVSIVAQHALGRVSANPEAQIKHPNIVEQPRESHDPDACKQAVLDLAASNMIAVRAPYTSAVGGAVHCRVISAALDIRADQAADPRLQTMAIIDVGSNYGTYVFRAPAGYSGPRLLTVDVDGEVENITPNHVETTLKLPSRGTFERIAGWSGAPRESEYVARLAQPKDTDFVPKLAAFISANFAALPPKAAAAAGLSRAELHDFVLRENGLSPEHCTEMQVAEAFTLTGLERARDSQGRVKYRIARKPGAVSRIEGVQINTLDPAIYAQFATWLAAQETPRRLRERAERERIVAEQRARKSEHESRWGSRDKAEIASIVQDFVAREGRRETASALAGEDFVRMPSAWHLVPASGPVPAYAERLKAFLATKDGAK
jgi:hypothetical protein